MHPIFYFCSVSPYFLTRYSKHSLTIIESIIMLDSNLEMKILFAIYWYIWLCSLNQTRKKVTNSRCSCSRNAGLAPSQLWWYHCKFKAIPVQHDDSIRCPRSWRLHKVQAIPMHRNRSLLWLSYLLHGCWVLFEKQQFCLRKEVLTCHLVITFQALWRPQWVWVTDSNVFDFRWESTDNTRSG
jgi:hypothetical protein